MSQTPLSPSPTLRRIKLWTPSGMHRHYRTKSRPLWLIVWQGIMLSVFPLTSITGGLPASERIVRHWHKLAAAGQTGHCSDCYRPLLQPGNSLWEQIWRAQVSTFPKQSLSCKNIFFLPLNVTVWSGNQGKGILPWTQPPTQRRLCIALIKLFKIL